MRRACTLTLLTLALIGIAVPMTGVVAAPPPEPSPYPIAWEIDFEYQTPRRIVVNVPGSRAPKAYWYLPYTVTNEGEETQVFIPQFDLLTEDGKAVRAGRNLPKQVFDAIRARERNDLMVPPTKAGGELRVGIDQARDSVAVWEEPLRDMGTFRIYVGGLSGEFVELTDDDGKPVVDAKGEPIILRKTLQLTYHLNGDEVYPGEDRINEGVGRTGSNHKVWVMR
jgi:hypothetical protein